MSVAVSPTTLDGKAWPLREEKVTEDAPLKQSTSCSRHRDAALGGFDPLSLAIKLESVMASVDSTAATALPRSRDGVTLLHEHRHLIQATTTLHGLLSMVTYLAIVPALARENGRAGKKLRWPIEHPSEPSIREWFTWFEATDRDHVAPGFRKDLPYRIRRISERPREVVFRNSLGVFHYPVPAVVLHVEQSARGFDLELGASGVCEAQADVQDRRLNHHVPGERTGSHPVFPYNVFDCVVDHLLERAGGARPGDFVVAVLADRALMTAAPGYHAVQYLQAHALDPARPIHALCDEIDAQHPLDQAAILRSAQSDLATITQELGLSQHKAEMFGWLLKFIDEGLRARHQDPDHFLRPFSAPDPWTEAEALLQERFVPIITDAKQAIRGINTASEIDAKIATEAVRFLQGLRFVADVHLSPQTSPRCALYDSCGQPFKDRRVCLDTPWRRSEKQKDYDGTCATGSAFAFVGAVGKKVKLQLKR